MGVNGAAAAAAVLVFAAVAVPGRGRRAVRRRLEGPDRNKPRVLLWLAALLRRLGGAVGGIFSVEPDDEALVGVSVLAALAAAVSFGFVGGLVALAALPVVVRARRRGRDRDRRRQIERGLPEVVDLFGLVIGAGRSTVNALSDIAPRTPEPFRSELAAVVRRAAAGEPFVDSMSRLRAQLGGCVASLVYAVTAAEIDGVPLRPALERAGDEAHRLRRVRAEEAARRVPVLMLFPLVFCILPAFCLLTVVPLLVGSIADLQLPG